MIFLVIVIVIVNEIILFSLTNIFVTVIVNENHTVLFNVPHILEECSGPGTMGRGVRQGCCSRQRRVYRKRGPRRKHFGALLNFEESVTLVVFSLSCAKNLQS